MKNLQNNKQNSFQELKKLFLLSGAGKLFLVLIILPFIFQSVVIGMIAFTGNLKLIFLITPFVSLIFTALSLSWFIILGTSLYSKLPEENDMDIKRFKFNLIYTATYITFFTINFALGGIISFGLLFLFHIYAMYSIFYGLYFISKSLASVEKQRIVRFEDYVGNLFMFWFFPIGIWILQPKINKIFKQ